MAKPLFAAVVMVATPEAMDTLLMAAGLRNGLAACVTVTKPGIGERPLMLVNEFRAAWRAAEPSPASDTLTVWPLNVRSILPVELVTLGTVSVWMLAESKSWCQVRPALVVFQA